MDKKTKLYVFAKKEVFLIFVFMILIACTSFTFGIKVGKKYAYEEHGIIPEDQKKIELLSLEEEKARDIFEEESNPNRDVKEDAVHARLEEEIKKQIDEADSDGEGTEMKTEGSSAKEKISNSNSPSKEKIREILAAESREVLDKVTPKKGHTIQLAAYRSKKEAEEFAQGFVVRGYTPLIREVEISGKGTWFRVVLGEFNTVDEAKEYINLEKSLFQGEDYIIRPLD